LDQTPSERAVGQTFIRWCSPLLDFCYLIYKNVTVNLGRWRKHC